VPITCENLKKPEKKEKNNEKTNFPIFLNRNISIYDYDFKKYIECGMKLDISIAIDLTTKSLNHAKPNLAAA